MTFGRFLAKCIVLSLICAAASFAWPFLMQADEGTRYEPAARSGRYEDNVERWRDLVARYDWDVDQALDVIRCESEGIPSARNPNSYAKNLWQLNGWEWKAHELYGANADYMDPVVATGVAYWIWVESGRSFGMKMGWLASEGCWSK